MVACIDKVSVIIFDDAQALMPMICGSILSKESQATLLAAIDLKVKFMDRNTTPYENKENNIVHKLCCIYVILQSVCTNHFEIS